MGAHRAAVVQGLGAALLDAGEIRRFALAKAEFARDNFPGEITLADEQGHDEHAGREHAAQDAGNGRLQFPEAFNDLGKKAAPTQFVRVLISRRAGIGVHGRAVPDEHERRIRIVFLSHAQWLAQPTSNRKPRLLTLLRSSAGAPAAKCPSKWLAVSTPGIIPCTGKSSPEINNVCRPSHEVSI